MSDRFIRQQVPDHAEVVAVMSYQAPTQHLNFLERIHVGKLRALLDYSESWVRLGSTPEDPVANLSVILDDVVPVRQWDALIGADLPCHYLEDAYQALIKAATEYLNRAFESGWLLYTNSAVDDACFIPAHWLGDKDQRDARVAMVNRDGWAGRLRGDVVIGQTSQATDKGFNILQLFDQGVGCVDQWCGLRPLVNLEAPLEDELCESTMLAHRILGLRRVFMPADEGFDGPDDQVVLEMRRDDLSHREMVRMWDE